MTLKTRQGKELPFWGPPIKMTDFNILTETLLGDMQDLAGNYLQQ